MIKSCLRYLVSGLLLFCATLTCHAEDEIRWGFAEFPPHLYLDANGNPNGEFARIVQTIFKQAGIEYQILNRPNRRALNAINTGLSEFSIGPVFVLDNPEDYYISEAVVAKVTVSAFWVGNKSPIVNMDDLVSRSVILISSFKYAGYRDFIENPTNKVTLAVNVENHVRALRALSRGRADYMLGYRAPTLLADLEVQIASLNSSDLYDVDIRFFLRKSATHAEEKMRKLQTAYELLRQSQQ